MTIDTKDFLNLVADEVKGRASLHQRRFLEQSPERWLAAIEELLGELDQQLQHLDVRLTTVRQAADAGTLALHLAVQDELDLQRRIGKATTFRLNVERRLAEVRDLFADLSELSPAEQRARMLERAIRTRFPWRCTRANWPRMPRTASGRPDPTRSIASATVMLRITLASGSSRSTSRSIGAACMPPEGASRSACEDVLVGACSIMARVVRPA